MRRKRYNKKKFLTIILIVISVMIVGYAFLSSTLNIFGGLAVVGGTNWQVRWSNIQVNNDSNAEVITAPHLQNNNTSILFQVALNLPGDYYEFTVDAYNSGSIDAMIDSVNCSIYDEDDNEVHPEFLEYTVTYDNGVELAPNQLLRSNSTATYKVRLEYSTNIDPEDLPTEEEAFRFEFGVTYIQADDNAYDPSAGGSFEEDSWDTIIHNVRNGNVDMYELGDTKTIDMGEFGTHTLRIANKSTPSECSTAGFSQTACGFVIEFADIITTHQMNPYTSDVTTNGSGNIGGWPASEMRTYVNSDIYNALPTELKSAIINTTVVSGFGSNDSSNFTSTDKLYLLSTHEVYEDDDGNTSSGIDYYDTAYNNTRQLDYYSSQNITISNYSGASGASKYRNDYGYYYYWWLRSVVSETNDSFYYVSDSGYWGYTVYSNTNGVSPAFRIG